MTDNMKLGQEEKYDLVFLWKQNDSGIYGRRPDMILKELARSDRIHNIVHFDAPIDIDNLEKYKESLKNDDGTHYGIIYDNAMKAYNGEKTIYGVHSYTYIYKKRGLQRDDYYTMDNYFEYVNYVLKKHGIGKENKVILWNSPINYNFQAWIDYLQPDYIISDVIDDQRVWAKTKTIKKNMTKNYKEALSKSDLILCNCKEMYDRLTELKKDFQQKVYMIPNGCESYDDSKVEKPELLKNLHGPIIGQVSNLEKKIDIELLEECAIAHPDWNIVLIGSCHASDGIEKLKEYNNIYMPGAIPYEEVKAYIKNFDVAIIAHRVVALNEAMNPLKLYVYCSLGAKVVSTDIPGIEELKSVIKVADSNKNFIRMIEETLEHSEPYSPEEIALINRYSWNTKVGKILSMVPLPQELGSDGIVTENKNKAKGGLKEKFVHIPGINYAFQKWEKVNEKIKKVNSRIDDVTAINNRKISSLQKQMDQLEKEIALLATQAVNCNKEQMVYTDCGYGKISVFLFIEKAEISLRNKIESIKHTIKNHEYELLIVYKNDLQINNIEEAHVRYISCDADLNYGQLLNYAAAQAEGQYYIFLNQNIELTDLWLEEMLYISSSHPDIGTASLKIQYGQYISSDSKRMPYKVYSTGVAFETGIRKNMIAFHPTNRDQDRMDSYFNQRCTECISAPIELFGVEKNKFDLVHGFCELYDDFYTLIDFNLRLLEQGYKNIIGLNSYIYLNKITTWKEHIKDDDIKLKGIWQSWLVKYSLLGSLKQGSSVAGCSFKVGMIVDTELAKFSSENRKIIEIFKNFFEKYHADIIFYDADEKYTAESVDILLDFASVQHEDNEIFRFISIQVLNVNSYQEADQSSQAYDITLSYDIENQDYGTVEENLCKQLLNELEAILKPDLAEDSIDICGAMPNTNQKFSWGDYHYAISMKKELELLGYKVHIKTYPEWFDFSNSKYVIVLRGIKAYYPKVEGQVTIMWNISHPEAVSEDEYNLFDLIYVASERLALELKERLKKPVLPLLQCTDVDVMTFEEREKQYDLLFIGNSRGIYRKILQDLMPTEHDLTIYGDGWAKFPVAEYVKDVYLDNNKVGQAYHDAKILLNDHWDDMRNQGIVSNRLFDALAVEAFVISDYMPEIENLFGDNIVMYHTPDDLRNKIDYYLTHEEERKKISQNGRKIVEKEHTFKVRMHTIIHDIKERGL